MINKVCLYIFCLMLSAFQLSAQLHLQKKISVNIVSQPLQDALLIISNEGGFNFSYNSKIIKQDSLVSVSCSQKPVIDVLRYILNASYDFKESGNYVIIRRKAVSTSNVVSAAPSAEDVYTLSGFVIDEETGDKIANVTIYEKQNLLSTMSDEKGYFTMRLKKKYETATVSISKEQYKDTSVDVKTNYDQKFIIALQRAPVFSANNFNVVDSLAFDLACEDSITENLQVEEKWISRLLLSSKQKIRSLNLKKFYTTRAYQFSVLPGISSHGKLNPQVINGVSINLLGAYSGGTDVFEFGGLFNIDKLNVKYVQLAGVYNIVGGNMQGFQYAGIHNYVNHNVSGVQVSGFSNVIKHKLNGIQIGSVYNRVGDSAKGVQICGLVNNVKKDFKGVQISGLLNKAAKLKGMQIGLINYTEGSSGTSLGFINISKGKRHKHRVGFLLRLPRKS